MKNISLLLTLALLATAGTATASEELAKNKGCLSCHAVDTRKIGPAYRDVAKKYAGQADAEAKLAEKIVKGGAGAWGNIPMPPNLTLTPAEAKQLANWVLSFK